MNGQDRVLVIAAHPDDEVLGGGGTMAALSQQGHDVDVVILGEGITSRSDILQENQISMGLEKLRADCRKVADILGVRQLIMESLPDNKFDTVPLLDIVKIVERVISALQPDVIFTHSSGDLNIDHAITCRAVLTATRPMEGNPIRELYAFEIPSSTEWAFDTFNSGFKPNTFVDVSETLPLKIQALNVYESETRPFPHPRSTESLECLAKVRGAAAGLQAAEGFQLIRKIQAI